MTSQTFGIGAALMLYFAGMMAIGIFYCRRMRSVSDYILGSRSLGTWVTSMSAEAADMSGWLMLGLPGYAYCAGMQAGWIALGLIIGTYINWKVVAGRLRTYTQVANDSLTLPDYLHNRFHDSSNALKIVSAIFILIFFLIYTSSGFVAGGKMFHAVFNVPYSWAMLLGAFVIVFYTFLGGFMAVCWTDFVQGVMMFFAILIVPFAGMVLLGGPSATFAALGSVSGELLNPFTAIGGKQLSLMAVISLMAWGLGYFGQPHIIIRFMAIRTARQIPQARRIAMVWVVLSLTAAVAVGLVGRVFLKEPLQGAATETVFIVMTDRIFTSFFAGIVFSAVLAAIMSTASAQLLVTSSAVSQDIYKALIHKQAGEKELLQVSRWSVIVVAVIAVALGANPENRVLDLVAYAWAGFGAAFGPAILVSLYWKRMTGKGALAGIIMGGTTVLVWKQFGWFGMYEIVPGFVLSVITIIAVSLIDKTPSEKILREFELSRSCEPSSPEKAY
jgi:sodium/proline symporter